MKKAEKEKANPKKSGEIDCRGTPQRISDKLDAARDQPPERAFLTEKELKVEAKREAYEEAATVWEAKGYPLFSTNSVARWHKTRRRA